jgi:hypothetical protein
LYVLRASAKCAARVIRNDRRKIGLIITEKILISNIISSRNPEGVVLKSAARPTRWRESTQHPQLQGVLALVYPEIA